MSAVPTVVLFDLDGVLAHYAHAPRLALLARRCGVPEAEVARALFDSGLERDADLGLHDATGQVEEFAKRLGSPVSLDDCIEARQAAMQADMPMLALAQALSRRTQVAILTNNNLLLRDYLPRICPPLFPLFGGRVFCSAQFRMCKPDPGVFLQCLEAIGTGPAAALFIDDKPANVEGARSAGLRAHHYRDLPTLRAELQRLGLGLDAA